MNTRNFIICFCLTTTTGFAAPSDVPPKFDEVYQLLRNNLGGVDPADLDRAAVKGLLEQLPGQVILEGGASSNAAGLSAPDTLSRATVYDDSYAYFRISAVEGHLAEKLRASYQDLAGKSKIKGVILDLRFATGTDYTAAAAVADCFLNTGQKLLDWGAGSASATKKTNAITVPVAILVNSQTAGSAEALAAALREADTGLILGGTTAGQANIFKDFALANGGKLRIATSQIKLGDGTALVHGLKPDITVEETLADERAYLDDPYKNLHPSSSSKTESATNSSLSSTDQPAHRRTNEAELVRERLAGQTDDDADETTQLAAPEEPLPPAIADPSLARALDLLKGIAVLQQSHPG